MWLLWTSKNHIYFSIQIYFKNVFLRQCICMCVKDTCWKFSIYYKFTIKELLKLTKEITRWHNIILKLEKIKFINTLKNNEQLGMKLTVQRGRNNYRTIKEALNIEQLGCHNWQRGVDNTTWIENISSPPLLSSP